MAESRDAARLHWLDPGLRGVLPIREFHLPRRLARTALSGKVRVTSNVDFAATLAGCAEPAEGRGDTWINPEITRLFVALHEEGVAHSVECWEGATLVGGLYGVALGGAFFGESMFSRVRDASKVALVHLVARLALGEFTLLDTQFLTRHLTQFGAHEILRADYKARLAAALEVDAVWQEPDPEALAATIRALRSTG
jgi:leucyl/phenylalanyl-tRNA--protein transferase